MVKLAHIFVPIDVLKQGDNIEERRTVRGHSDFKGLEEPVERISLMSIGLGDCLQDLFEQLAYGVAAADVISENEDLIVRSQLAILLMDGGANDYVFDSRVLVKTDLK